MKKLVGRTGGRCFLTELTGCSSYYFKGVWKSRNPESGIRNPEPELEQKRNLRNKNWRRFCFESVTNNNCSIKNFHPHIIFIYCYYIFYCHIFCVRRNIAFFENFIYTWALQLRIMIDMSTPPPFASFSSQCRQ